MDGMPGVITSDDDFAVNDAGLLVTETTITQFEGWDPDGKPEFVRSRKAMQYGRSIDDFARIMLEGNNGGYANDWLIGDTKTGEVAQLELGLKEHTLKRTRDGCFVGSNFPEGDALIGSKPSSTRRMRSPRPTPGGSGGRQLMAENEGKIDVEVAKALETDVFDAFEGKPGANERTLTGRGRGLPPRRPRVGLGPVLPRRDGAVEGDRRRDGRQDGVLGRDGPPERPRLRRRRVPQGPPRIRMDARAPERPPGAPLVEVLQRDEVSPMPSTASGLDPIVQLRPRRRIEGASAILLPFEGDGAVDWDGFAAHARRTADLGLTPAVNMDTGYAHLIDEDLRVEVLRRTREVLDGRPFLAGAFVGDRKGSRWDRDAYLRQADLIQRQGGTPVLFQSHGLTALDDPGVINAYAEIGRQVDRFVAFELGTAFAPFGRIYSMDVFRGLLGIPACIGAKHSSLHREPEWLRLIERDRLRPDFRVYTGNDLAIDMVMYGSDYLLGLSTFAPDAFARRDRLWEAGDPAFYEINDLLQYLGFFAFRPPVPAYKHSAAMFLHLKGWIASGRTHPGSPARPLSDLEILHDIDRRLGLLTGP